MKLKARSRTPASRNLRGAKKNEVQATRAKSVDLVLSPQAEAPREILGHDQSRAASPVRELSWTQFDKQVQILAAQAKAFKPEAVVGLVQGGVFVGGALASALRIEFFPVRISHRSRDSGRGAYGKMPKELKGRRVLLVDDVASSGDSLEKACALAKKAGVKDIRTASLLSKEKGYAPHFTALQTDELHVFPWDYHAVTEDARFEVDPDKAGA